MCEKEREVADEDEEEGLEVDSPKNNAAKLGVRSTTAENDSGQAAAVSRLGQDCWGRNSRPRIDG